MTRPLRALIVDDEKPARHRLLDLLQRRPDVHVAGACAGGAEALRRLEAERTSGHPIDLLFLDVQMPELDGFAVLDALAEAPPVVVFVTAYDRYALQAFDAHAVDYLLKPYSDERFAIALERAARFLQAGETDALARRMRALLAEVERRPSAAGAEAPPYLDRIVLKSRGRAWLLPVADVRWVGAEGTYVKLYTRSGAHLHRALLGELERQLDPRRFVRIHRSHLVNLDAVAELLQDSHGAYTVVLDDGTMLKLSRTYRAALQERLGQPL